MAFAPLHARAGLATAPDKQLVNELPEITIRMQTPWPPGSVEVVMQEVI